MPIRDTLTRLPRRLAGSLLALLLSSGAAQAADLDVSEARLRLMPGDLPGAGYFQLHNTGDEAVTLVGADSEAYGKVMLHMTVSEDGMSSMHAVSELEVASGDTLEFAPRGYHLMLMKRAHPLAVGDEVEVTLEFAGDRRLPVTFDVVSPRSL
ncbi:copper chaperone PCu(A)C [Halomonas koreensis]|uniref:Copper chaperone PCu(A)C n=1 Tax=Halomonas koreensis TaxID=245385 RepID=A0ABU1FZQ1_9GAMM|nr:copper chaperone PCu(A)C [Halomonas koreensis]MDR5866136.1 copper chaperone PCu(A)C [Halomonas koreensis]